MASYDSFGHIYGVNFSMGTVPMDNLFQKGETLKNIDLFLDTPPLPRYFCSTLPCFPPSVPFGHFYIINLSIVCLELGCNVIDKEGSLHIRHQIWTHL